MKKIKFMAVSLLLLGLLSLTSCKKEWGCSCVDFYKGTGNSYTELTDDIIKGKNKKEANELCKLYDDDGLYMKTECKAVSIK